MKRTVVMAMAFFSCAVGAGFASGQEILQYYAAFGWWGVLGAIAAMALMALTTMILMRYGSFYRAASHDEVFRKVTHPAVATFLDYSITFAQFCICFVMLADTGANLEQQWGLPAWVGSAVMVALVALVGALNVDKITDVISAVTPLIIVLFLIAAVHAYVNPPADLSASVQYAQGTIETGLPNWWVSTVNYVSINLMGCVSMGIVMGGATSIGTQAGRAGILAGVLFGTLLLMMVVALLFNAEAISTESLPTLAMVTEINSGLGVFASVVIYLMIFSTCVGNYYSLSRRVSGSGRRFSAVAFALLALCFVLSLVDFVSLIGFVFPILGYIGIFMMGVLIYSWWRGGRGAVAVEERIPAAVGAR